MEYTELQKEYLQITSEYLDNIKKLAGGDFYEPCCKGLIHGLVLASEFSEDKNFSLTLDKLIDVVKLMELNPENIKKSLEATQ